MKKLFLGTALMLMSISTFAQTTFEKTMSEKIVKMQSSHSTDELQALSNDFARIADKEKTNWLPYYYTALSTLQNARMIMMDPSKLSQLDALADAADKNIAKADELSPMNSEIYILKKMSHSVRMMANPMQRFRTEGAAAQEALSFAKKLNPENPRTVLLDAEDTYFTPEQFGGSKAKGLELFQKALDMFKTFKPKTALDPNWGKQEAEYFLSQAK